MITENTSHFICDNRLYVEDVFDVWAPQIPLENLFNERANIIYEASSEPFGFYNDVSKLNVIIEPSMANTVTIGAPEFAFDAYRIGSCFIITPIINATIQTLEETKTEEDAVIEHAPVMQITLREDYDEVINRIATFANLSHNWDSYGAYQIKMDCIERATNFLLEIIEWEQDSNFDIPAPFAVPTPEGGIQLEWQNKHKYLEIKILKDSPDMEFFASDESPEGEYELEGVLSSPRESEEIYYWLSSGAAGSLKMLFGKKAA